MSATQLGKLLPELALFDEEDCVSTVMQRTTENATQSPTATARAVEQALLILEKAVATDKRFSADEIVAATRRRGGLGPLTELLSREAI